MRGIFLANNTQIDLENSKLNSSDADTLLISQGGVITITKNIGDTFGVLQVALFICLVR